MTRFGILGHTENNIAMLCELSDVVSKVAGLLGASRGRISGIEVKDDVLTFLHVILEIMTLTTRIDAIEKRTFFSDTKVNRVGHETR
jgi:DNA-binding transcriptional regulator WhiA